MLMIFDGIKTFFAKISTGWYYLLGGLLLSVILALIICAIFRIRNKTATSIFVIVFAIFGVFFTYRLINVNTGDYVDPGMPSAGEIVAELNAYGKDNWENTNGGFTYEQIKEVQKDSEAPIRQDVIINMYFQDFGNLKTFSMEKDGKCYNISFIELDNDVLFFDGSMMNSGYFPINNNFFGIDIKLDSWVWHFDRSKLPEYIKAPREFRGTFWNFGNNEYHNVISLSSRSGFDFMEWFYKYVGLVDPIVENTAFKIGREYTYDNLYKNFINFCDASIELVGTADSSITSINNFYSYLYSVAKEMKIGDSKLVDVSSNGLLCAPIPEEERINYPISASKLSDYNSQGDDTTKYYGVFNCNIGINLTKYKANSNLDKSEDQDDYINEITTIIEKPDVSKIEKQEYSKIFVNFEDTNNSNVTNDILSQNPITVIFRSGDKIKKIIVESLTQLNAKNVVLLPDFKDWSYEIISEALIFENYSGTFEIVENTVISKPWLIPNKETFSISFKYYYMDNYVMASVGLNPIGTINRTEFDLSNDPVKIILTNKVSNKVYQFVFDSNDLLDSKVSCLVELGDYIYNILSAKLIFASVTGELSITSTNKIMLFNYAQNLSKDDLQFNITITTLTNYNYISLSSTSQYVDIIRNKLSGDKSYLVDITFFDSDGLIVEKFSHTHSSSGYCFDSWSVQNLVDGVEYIVQVRFTDKNDSTITYLSDVSTMTYQSSTGYEISYTASVV